jgi:ABC-type nitrate/sulfonate/bicarbonate transport system ATPase subunit
MSPGPGRIQHVVSVDFPRPRTLDMRDSEAFVRQARTVREMLET